MNQALIQQPLAITLPATAANPVDVYINSLSSRRSQDTMRTALRSVLRKWLFLAASKRGNA